MQPLALVENILIKNWAIKVFSLLLAITLWFFVMGEKKAEFFFADVPVEFINKPPDMVVTRQSPRSINLRISGSRTLLATLSANRLKSVVDLEGAKPGKMVFSDLSETIKLPDGTRISSVSPAEVEVHIESLISKRVPVSVDLVGEPAPGYVVQGISIDPPFVDIRVGEHEATQIQKVTTRPLDITGEDRSIVREVPLVLTNLEPPRSISKKKVQVAVTINSRIREKSLAGIPVTIVGNRYQARVMPETIQIRIQYPYQMEETIADGSIMAVIDMSGSAPGTFNRQPVIKLPEGVSLVEVIPERCEVVLANETAKER